MPARPLLTLGQLPSAQPLGPEASLLNSSELGLLAQPGLRAHPDGWCPAVHLVLDPAAGRIAGPFQVGSGENKVSRYG